MKYYNRSQFPEVERKLTILRRVGNLCLGLTGFFATLGLVAAVWFIASGVALILWWGLREERITVERKAKRAREKQALAEAASDG
jgi:hypothetical protein